MKILEKSYNIFALQECNIQQKIIKPAAWEDNDMNQVEQL